MFNTELDLGGFKDEEDLSGMPLVPPGKYHVRVTDVREGKGKTPAVVLRYQILAGTDPQAIGMYQEDNVFLTDSAIKRVALVALRLGLISRGDLGKKVNVNWLQAYGRELIVEIHDEEFERKDGTKGHTSKVTFGGVWDLNHPEVKDVPRAAVSSPAGNGQGGTTTSQTKAATAASQDDFSDI